MVKLCEDCTTGSGIFTTFFTHLFFFLRGKLFYGLSWHIALKIGVVWRLIFSPTHIYKLPLPTHPHLHACTCKYSIFTRTAPLWRQPTQTDAAHQTENIPFHMFSLKFVVAEYHQPKEVGYSLRSWWKMSSSLQSYYRNVESTRYVLSVARGTDRLLLCRSEPCNIDAHSHTALCSSSSNLKDICES